MTHLPKVIMDCFDKHYDLVFVDYDDKIGDHQLPDVLKAIREQDWSYIDETIDEDWLLESQWNGVKYAKEELAKEIQRALDLDEDCATHDKAPEDRIDTFIDNYSYLIEDVILERDSSTPTDDLIRHTPDPVMFYDTGLEIGEYDDHDESVKEIKRALHLTGKKYNQYNRQIESLLANAGYGGRLVVYFLGDIQELMKIGEPNTITFSNPHIAIIDTMNGSGDDEYFDGLKFSLPYAPDNLFMDKPIKYNYTYAVCGMSDNWCDDTGVKFSTRKVRQNKTIEASSLNAEVSRDEHYKAVFASGKCTAGDMDLRRHRDTYYLNEIPCGTHCPHCGTFWID